ncbi:MULTISPECIES: ectoine/hydroxyectoine ABC transporter permease subunit EhuC [Bacillus]|uniref:Amino acid ABC transporter permease n=2 Tax=Bacillus TaxID=1386 RepID=A0A0M5JL15_9BACI|nr:MULTISPECIES: ectoine/hydroxyectoine ABC transporter permease subunit EhuC [Bacillus]ALC80327.1 amino acid ABC transporter permease [Bacillus gobiensis]MBP1083832.1 polar amino acid transport system permease protein [Bacillus capparidis]MED1098315.1 ectoine/hydroxyectoine ABC transporter permease subunit EhuC [Bacillus capparidis]
MYSIPDLAKPLLSGAAVTLQVMIYSAVLAAILAFLFGFMKLSQVKLLKIISGIYIEIFRGTSLLIQLFWLYFALPMFGVQLSAMAAGVLALGLNYGAYGAEVVRGSILAVPKGQTEATIALNMEPAQRMRLVILPQAIMLMIPSFGNLLIELLKGTALVSLVTLSDLTFQAMSLRTTTMQTTEIFTLLLLFYFIIAYPITLGVRWFEKRLSARRVS